jgi:hypothetical protein
MTSTSDTVRRRLIAGKRRLATSALIASLGMLGGCSDSSSGPGTPDPVGAWTLATVDGKSMPFTYSSGQISGKSYKNEFLAVRLTLYSDGKYLILTSERETIGGVVTTSSYEETGRWSIAKTSVVVTADEDGSSATGTIAGDVLTLDTGFGTMVFRR